VRDAGAAGLEAGRAEGDRGRAGEAGERGAVVPGVEAGELPRAADGGTGLYDSTRAAVQAVRDGYDPTRINAVLLLTDGKCEDDPPGCDLDALLSYLGSTERDPVRVFPVAYGEDANVDELAAIADASRARLYRATDPLTIERVFQQVVSNF